jgi:FAD/FMN-containing dehydrogenase
MPIFNRDRLAQLARDIAGKTLLPGVNGYDAAREVWNARFNRNPACIVLCREPGDVAKALRFARAEGLPLSVKCGGHDYAGNTVGEGSLLLDLSPMREVRVDPANRLVTVQAGATWADVDRATQAHGLATPGGTVSSVGVAGFTLGGGEGWLIRKHGLAVDNLRGADVVTAEGDRVRASANENPDLFWAIRGGGGNFGVVTSFEYALHEVGPELLAGQVLYPAARAGELLRFYRDFFSDAPDEVMCYPFLLRVPPLDVFPREFHGTLALDFVVAYVGEVSEGLAHLQPFRDRGDPILDVVAPQPYVDLQQAFDAGMGKGNRWYSRSQRMNELSDEAIDTLVKHLAPFPGEFTSVYLSPPGGARERVAPHATAYPNRSSAHDLHIFPGWIDASQDEEIMAWADAFHEAMAPHGNGSVYVNLLGDGEAGRVPAAYAGNYRRLKELKTKWDPGNLFRGNHNIPPSG